MKVFFSIPGEPIGKQSVRTGSGRAYMPEKTTSWTAYAVEMIARQWPKGLAPFDGPMRVTILGVKPRPKYLLAKKYPDGRFPCATKPDTDNISKMVCDAMTKAGAWKDDSHISDERIIKLYMARDGDSPRVEVLVEALDPMEQVFVNLQLGTVSAPRPIDNDDPFG